MSPGETIGIKPKGRKPMKYQKFIYFTLLSFLLSQAQSPAFMPGRVITKLNIDPKIGIESFTNSPSYQYLKKANFNLNFVELMAGGNRSVQKLILLK